MNEIFALFWLTSQFLLAFIALLLLVTLIAHWLSFWSLINRYLEVYDLHKTAILSCLLMKEDKTWDLRTPFVSNEVKRIGSAYQQPHDMLPRLSRDKIDSMISAIKQTHSPVIFHTQRLIALHAFQQFFSPQVTRVCTWSQYRGISNVLSHFLDRQLGKSGFVCQ
jgi:hypothetical protein